jgi:adenosine deaminase
VTEKFPLAELHCHLEGSIAPAMARRLAAKHGVDISDVHAGDDTYLWNNFAEFIVTFDRISEVVVTPQDYFDITRDYYVRAASEGLIYGETFVSPTHAEHKGVSYEALIDAVDAGMAAAERETGVIARIIVTCVRHMGPERAETIAKLTERFPHRRVTGFGMGGDENVCVPKDFARAFAIARGAGLGLTAHAGELAGPQSLLAAIRDLGISRVGHGVRANEDPKAMAELKDRGITMELCPSSNVALGLFPDVAGHPVVRYAREGLLATINSDDPPYFSISIGSEYAKVAKAHDLDAKELLGFTRRAVEAAFCEDDIKRALLARIEIYGSTI